MAIITDIQWCDSTLNIQMGCEGCELVKGRNKERPRCYAKILVDRYGGTNKGFPTVFEEPVIYMDRLQKISGWKDLTGTNRLDKTWLNGLPRVIFLNDMGDTFSKGMPQDWFAEALPTIAKSPHIFMLLTKWANRLAKFAEKYELPSNLWCGTSVTSGRTMFRAYELNNVKCTGVKFLSNEPMWTPLKWQADRVNNIKLFIYGGESGGGASPFKADWLIDQIAFCKDNSKRCFIKQLGSNVYYKGRNLSLNHKGGIMEEWAPELQVRQFPENLVSNFKTPIYG